jgi:TonB family protein
MRRILAFVPAWTWLASLAVHGGVVLGVGWLAYRSLERPALMPTPAPAGESSIPVELPVFAEGTLLAERTPDPVGEPVAPAGGTTIPRVDTGRHGHGGDVTVDKPAVHLSDVDERLRYSPDMLSRLDRDQMQRIRSSRERASRADRRSTTHPMELTFLASGTGDRAERRSPSTVDPSRGAILARSAALLGGNVGVPDPDGEVGPFAERGGARAGTNTASPGVGVRDGRSGADHRSSADVMHARPDVTLGPVAVPALVHQRPNDDVDSDQEVATTVRALVHASSAGGLAGDGAGGSGGGGDPGAGGAPGAGSHPAPLGEGEGDWYDLNSSDPRLMPYFRRIHAKVDPLWADAFPKSALLELKQGTVILEFVILSDGTAKVTWPPLRPSGVDEFDRNCANALRKASPFEPIPRELGRSSLRVRAPFVASNPIVK